MNASDLTIVFIGFDGYSDLWDDCIGLFKVFWQDCPYRTLFVNNEKEVKWDGIEVVHAGREAEWSLKVSTAISLATTPYICLLLEDFFIGKTIDTKYISEALKIIEEDDIRYYKLANLSRAVKNKDPQYKRIDYLHVIPESDEYGVSLQAAIWNKQYLKELIGEENYNAWVFEFDRTKESIEESDLPKTGCIFDDRNILNLKHGVVQSKFIPGTIKYFKRIKRPLHVSREVLSPFRYWMIQFVSFCKYSLPKPLRKPIKRLLEKMGVRFVSTKRG